jgi:LysR family transcriptional regulator, hypochlorite-specific transcription factor HypT
MLDIRWLEDLLTLADTRSFGKTAERRNVTQSGLSRRIQSLERWAAVPLIDRTAAPLALTEHGKSLAAVAAEVVRRLDQQRQFFAGARPGENLNVAATGLLVHRFFPDLLHLVKESLGEFSLTLQSGHLTQCYGALNEGRADVLICLLDHDGAIERRLQPSFATEPGFSSIIGRDKLIPLSVAGAAGKPRFAAGGGNPPFELVSYAPECALSWAIDAALARRPDVRVKRRQHSSSADGVRAMAVAGMGVAWLPENSTVRERDAGLLVRAGDPSLDIPLNVVAARSRYRLSPLAHKLWCLLSEERTVAVHKPALLPDLDVVTAQATLADDLTRAWRAGNGAMLGPST